MSLMMPETPTDHEPSVQDKGENLMLLSSLNLKGTIQFLGLKTLLSANLRKAKLTSLMLESRKENKLKTLLSAKLRMANEGAHQFNAGIQKSKQKSFPFKIHENEGHPSDNQKIEVCNCQPKTDE